MATAGGARARCGRLLAFWRPSTPRWTRSSTGSATVGCPALNGPRRCPGSASWFLLTSRRRTVASCPLLAMHVTAEEQLGSMARSRAKIPQEDELRVLTMMLAPADEGERSRMLAPLPEFVVSAWSDARGTGAAPGTSRARRCRREPPSRGPGPSHA